MVTYLQYCSLNTPVKKLKDYLQTYGNQASPSFPYTAMNTTTLLTMKQQMSMWLSHVDITITMLSH